ncbi:MFS transporter [Halioxenophilus sp. WMMB6]|uniref:MFS transporter n=1 Tax=Halioxenophilus sp. WMMB6 TaxID=3073815 RepID=UPI00295F23B2|nr:MFS transporter [Halioxenophilus sp. WMMB6]
MMAIMIGYVLNPLNGSLAVTSYPILSEHFAVPYAHLSAMVMYFMAATAVGQPLAGGIGDFLGRKTVFILGVVGFTLSSALAGLSDSYAALLFWRVGQATFSGVIMANGMALVAEVAPKEKVTSYVALLNSALVATTVLGFTLGGMILQFFDWPMLFLLNVPLGICALILAFFYIPKGQQQPANFTALSFIGVPVLPLAMALQAIVQGEPYWLDLMLFVIATAAVALAIGRSHSSRQQFRTVANFPFNLGCLLMLTAIALHFAVVFTLPAWSAAALGIESGMMGLYFSLVAGAQVLASPPLGRLLDKHGDRYLRWAALAAVITPLLLFLFCLNGFTLALALALFGIGMAASQLIAQKTSLQASPAESRALAMGLFSSYRSLGGLSGNALAAIVLAGFSTITSEAGNQVFEWGIFLFVVPLTLVLLLLPARLATAKRD